MVLGTDFPYLKPLYELDPIHCVENEYSVSQGQKIDFSQALSMNEFLFMVKILFLK